MHEKKSIQRTIIFKPCMCAHTACAFILFEETNYSKVEQSNEFNAHVHINAMYRVAEFAQVNSFTMKCHSA